MEKKYPIGGYAPGNYQRKCCDCGGDFLGDKRAVQCEPCAVTAKEKFDALSPTEQEELIKRNKEAIKDMFSKWDKPALPPLPEPILNDDDVRELDVKDGNNDREVAMLRWLRKEGWEPRNHTGWAKHADNESYYLTDKELWNEWNTQQKKKGE